MHGNRLRRVLFWMLLSTLTMSAGRAAGVEDFATKQRQLKQLHEQRKRDFEQKKRDFERRRKQKPAAERSTRTKNVTRKASAHSAPRPEACLVEFLVAVKRARSMQTILKYLPREKREAHARKVERFDPQQAAAQAARLKKQGGWDKDLLARMSTHPDQAKLPFYQGLVTKFQDLESVKVDGERAKIIINTHPPEVKLPDGRRPRGYVDMILEDNYWRFAGFRQDDILWLK